MPWDGESAAEEYIDYLAEHESGFLGGIPRHLIGTEEALGQIEHEARYGPLTPSPSRRMSITIGRRRRTMAKKAKKTEKAVDSKEKKVSPKVAKKAAKLAKKAKKKEDRRLKKLSKLVKKRDAIQKKIDKLGGQVVGAKKKQMMD